MLLEIYIMLSIIGIVSLFIAMFYNENVANLFIWPIALIIFGALFFGSYNIQESDTILSEENQTVIGNITQIEYFYDSTDIYYTEKGISFLWLGLSILCAVLFIWDIFNHLKEI